MATWLRRLCGLMLLTGYMAIPALAQNFTAFSASNIQNLQGTKLVSGTLYIQGTDQNNTPISFQCGGGGQVVRTPYTATITTGAIVTFNVCNPANTIPAGIYYHVWVVDQTSGSSTYGQTILNYGLVQWNGATFNFDNYTPTGNVSPPVGLNVTGNFGVNGNLSVTGSITGSTSGATLGNGSTVCDITAAKCNGNVMPVSTELGALMNACTSYLPSTGGVCDARGLSSPVTWTTNITNTKFGVEYILPAGVINRGSGVQWGLTIGWIHIHGSGFQSTQTNIVSGSSDSSSVFGQSVILTSVSVAGSTVTYNGTITGGAGNALAGKKFYVWGFTHAGNNGYFIPTSSTATTLVGTMATAVNETHAAQAGYPTLVGLIEMDHFLLSGGVAGAYQMDVNLTQSYMHDIAINAPGWGMNLDDSGCNCYNTFINNNFVNVRTGGNSNYNNWYSNGFGQSQTLSTYALKIDNGYMQKFDGVSIEDIPNSIYVDGTVHDLTVRNFNFENDGVTGSGSLASLPLVQPGAHRISFLGGADIVDLSGDSANSFGSASYLPIQHIWPGKFVQTSLGSSGFLVKTHTSYYGSSPGATVPTATWFSGGDFSIVAWVYPTYPTAFYGSVGYQIVANWGAATALTDRVALLLNGLTPNLEVYEGTNYTLKAATSPIIAQQWNQVVVTQTGGNTYFYINGSLINSTAQWSPNNVSRSSNYIGSPSGVQSLFASIAELAVYNTALSGTNVGNQYTLGTGSSGYEAGIIAGTYGGVPIALYPLSDLPTSLTLTSVSVSGTTATYHGTITGGGSNAFANYSFTIAGFSNAGNNGILTASASTATTLTITNANAVNETASATAAYAGTAVEAIAAANGTYTGPTILGSVTGIPGDQGSTQYSATFGGTTSYEYFIGFTDANGGVTVPSSGVYVGNFSPLTPSNYNTMGVQSWPLGAKYATIYKGDTAHALGLWVPVNSTFTDIPNGGSLSPNTAYYYRVAAINSIGTTTTSTETSFTTANDGNSTHQITVTALVDTAATGCKVYGRSTGAELLIGAGTLGYGGVLTSQTCTFTDSGSAIPSGALPGSNTAAIAFVASNVGVNDDGTRPSVSVTPPMSDSTGDHVVPGTDQAKQFIANQGSVCTNGELALSGGWQSTGTATVTAAAGTGQTCSWTITTGTTTAANPTVTDTLTNILPNATTVCELNIHGGTHTAAAGEGFYQSALSATAPVFTFDGTPTLGGTTYFVTRRCGP